MDTQELLHAGPPWHRHDDTAALCVIILILSVIGIYLFFERLNERIR